MWGSAFLVSQLSCHGGVSLLPRWNHVYMLLLSNARGSGAGKELDELAGWKVPAAAAGLVPRGSSNPKGFGVGRVQTTLCFPVSFSVDES